MTPIYEIQSEILTYLNEWKDFVWELDLEKNFGPEGIYKDKGGKFFRENRSEYATSIECLRSMNHMEHDGFPPDSYGYDFNQIKKWHEHNMIEHKYAKPMIEKSNWLDETLGAYLGTRFCALKMWYPAHGYIAWHTNWNVPSYNILFTYNSGEDGDGYWRHIDPTGSDSPVPNKVKEGDGTSKLMHIPDPHGWSCKVGYYGRKEEHEKIIWHSAYASKPRMTLGYVVYEEVLWRDMVEEIAGSQDVWPLVPYSEETHSKYLKG